MPEQKQRPTGIHIENCEDVTLTNNTGIGDMDFIVAHNSKSIKGYGNKHIIPNQESIPAKKRWFERPAGILILGVVASLLAWAVLHYYGLA